MNVTERATQIWPVLALAARNRQLLTYGILARLISVPPNGLGQLLEPVQAYCIAHELPPLTALVVSTETGLPGAGFIAATDVPRQHQRVMEFDWLAHGCPDPSAFADSASKNSK